MTPSHRPSVQELVDRYSRVRRAEGRGVQGAEQLRALPFRDLSRKHGYEWSVRARSFEALVAQVVKPLESSRPGRLRVVDAGSGVGWLAYRLARRGHDVAAVDVVRDDLGLGAHRHVRGAYLPVQAELDALPFADRTVDLVIYNASLHYAVDPARTLGEGLRVLETGGRIAIMDSPLYRDPESGESMKRERDERFKTSYGFHANPSKGYFTYDGLEALGRKLGVEWRLHRPSFGIRWRMKPWWARLRGLREPAQFALVVGEVTPRERREHDGAGGL